MWKYITRRLCSFYNGFCAKIIYQEFIVRNPGQILVYRESISVTSMHEKKQKKTGSIPKKKKARCKIFNSYKNINMNKLISSTFLHCPHLPSCFSNKWKRKRANIEKTSPDMRQRSSFNTSLRVLRYSNQESSPALVPRRRLCQQSCEIHVQQ